MTQKLAVTFRKRSLFKNWKEIALSKRVYFPNDYYHTKLAKRTFNSLVISLRQRWVRQRNNIVCETFIEKRQERKKMHVFIKLYQNVLKCKKKRYTERAIQDFRRDFLVTKAFKALKICHGDRFKGKQIINYQTENIQDFETRDVFSEEKAKNDLERRKINYDVNTCMFNNASGRSSPQVKFKECTGVSFLVFYSIGNGHRRT